MSVRILAVAAPLAACICCGAAQAAPVFFDDEAAFLAAAAEAGIALGFESFESYPDATLPPISTSEFSVDGFLSTLDDDAGAADFATDGKMTLVSNASDQPRFSFVAPVNAFAIDVIDVINGPGQQTFGVTVGDGAPVFVLSGESFPFFNVEFIGILDLDGSFSHITLNTGLLGGAFNLDRLQFGALAVQPDPSEMPEPTSLGLLLAGVGAATWLGRRSKARSASRPIRRLR